ncbi:MAG TPA: metal ABC transporter ATP-binding protein [Patescibacteria group bacterium]|jgi:zinc/manganese transport system ATP-binding protein|nr:metal ABC transporter ATP-binding protein [Patescibacteria group bacterium]
MSQPVLAINRASLGFGQRSLWQNLDLSVKPGEFVAVLGPNGSGKTSLLKTLLGLNQLDEGSILIHGQPPRRGNNQIGYVPQQKSFDKDLPIRGRDLIHFGLDGHHFGFASHNKSDLQRVGKVIDEVEATQYVDRPIGLMSGGEQQRLRIAQALLGKPSLLLCDEPLLSLDLKYQQMVSALIDDYRKQYGMAVMFVTHDINPILNMVDQVLYLVAGKWAIGKPEEVLTTERLSQLYGAPVDVLRVHDRIVVVSSNNADELNGHHV